jgi:cellulose synthase/poly-beta-1,6-N-acetylglucosamine synthase-like glycosyltransferase
VGSHEYRDVGFYACLFFGLYFEVFLLINFIEKKPAKKTTTLPQTYPFVSMIVPCFNEERTIAATITSLLSLQYPKDKLEILVVDDGSRDSTGTIAQRCATEDARIKYFYKENGGKYTALNFGIERAQGEIVGCLDADSFVAEDALIESIKTFEHDPKIMALAPAMKVHQPKKILELMQSVEYTFGVFYKKMCDNLGAINVLPGPFSLYKKEIFSKIGPFHHAHNTEDMEIAFRMQKHGLKIANAHTAFVHTTVPNTLRGLLKQRTRWSQGYLQNSMDYKYMYFNPRFGNFGMLVLPFGLIGFFAGMYAAVYTLVTGIFHTTNNVFDLWRTGVPVQVGFNTAHLSWFYLDTSMLAFLLLIAFVVTVVTIVLGKSIGEVSLSARALLSYFLLFSFVAPLWLLQATWGAVRARESSWR